MYDVSGNSVRAKPGPFCGKMFHDGTTYSLTQVPLEKFVCATSGRRLLLFFYGFGKVLATATKVGKPYWYFR